MPTENIPAGYQLVPSELTDEMIVAFAETWYSKRQAYDDPDMQDAYRDMLAAAPQVDMRPVGEVVLFGGDLKEVSWAGGEMPAPGTKLYRHPGPIDQTAPDQDHRADLAAYWGLSYASWLTLPRVLMEAMPTEWQERMAVLLNEYDDTLPNQPAYGTTVRITKDGKLVPTPEWLTNYQHPDRSMIAQIKGEPITEGASNEIPGTSGMRLNMLANQGE